MTKTFTITVHVGDGIIGSDTEYIVRVTVEIDGVNIGQVRLAGGNYSNAVDIAQSLKNYSDTGSDLMEILPVPVPAVAS